MISKIVNEISRDKLLEDLDKYRREACRLGATDAVVIGTDEILIDERVRMKCLYPRCGAYGTNAHCPPHAMDLEQVRKAVNRYSYAIFCTIQVPPESFVGPHVYKERSYIPSNRKINKVVTEVESLAFYDGYYLAMGFSSGPCKPIFCPDLECAALVPGKECRARLRARGSMEGAGMDAFRMATQVGWDIYPCGWRLKPEDVPHGRTVGLVLIH
ncbi:MAG: DUF2284 domain-containing protein [Chloroflexi bacterium]|nr:DUF2284 domain-containing protein [Chloroflexota bacterium]